jgi:Holliday junction resolvase-like predicted endonuclease
MSDHFPPPDDGAVKRAVRVLEEHKFTVLEENWRSGEHQLTIVATPGAGILAGAEVRSAASSVSPGCVTALTEERVSGVIRALRAWRQGNGGEFDELWFVIVTLHPDAAGIISGNAAEVG